MNKTIVDVLILLSLVVITIVLCLLVVTSSAIDIQLHDTYIVIDRFSFGFLILGPLICMVFLPIAAVRRFRSISTNVVLLVGLFLIGVLCYSITELQSGYMEQVRTFDGHETASQQRALDSLSDLINWMRGILVAVALAWTTLLYRTIRVWKEQQGPRSSL